MAHIATRKPIGAAYTGRPKAPAKAIRGTTIKDKTRTKQSLLCAATEDLIQEPRHLPNHSGNVLNGLEVMWRQHEMCDVIIRCSGARFRAHRVILASCADYFHDVISKDVTPKDDDHQCCTELTMDEYSAQTMETLLECMYTGRVLIDDKNVRDLLGSAAKLKFYSLQEACADHLKENLCAANSLRILAVAFTYGLTELAEAALHVAARQFLEVSEGSDYHQLGLDQLLALLARDDIATDTELEVFKRSLSWIEADKASRVRHAGDVMQTVRLALLSPSDVVDHVETVDYLMEDAACQRLVKEALYYHCLPARQSILQSGRTCPRSRSKRDVVLAIGGAPRLKSEPVSDSILVYDVLRDDWDVLTTMMEPRHHHAAAVLGGFLYVAGGEARNDQQSPVRSAHRYDPRTDSWMQVASMLRARESFQLGVLGGQLYAVGGRVSQNQSLADVERYNPSVDAWETVAPLSAPRRSVAVTAHGGRLYAIGGSGYKTISNKVERYNPLTDQWESRRSLQTPRFFSMLVSAGNRLFLFGGATMDASGDVTCCKQVDCYYPATDTWSSLSPMATPRAEAGCTLLNNRIYVIGGYSWDANERLSSVEVYDIDKDRWKPMKSVQNAYTGIAACTLTVYNAPTTKATTGPEAKYSMPEKDVQTMATKTQSEADEEEGVVGRRAVDRGRGDLRKARSSSRY